MDNQALFSLGINILIYFPIVTNSCYYSNQPEINLDLEDLGTAPTKSVEREYMQFISENLLAYTVIFQQLLPRFSRVDLASPKMSLMLYRLTKVTQFNSHKILFTLSRKIAGV